MKSKVVKGIIYKAKRGFIYDNEQGKFNCYSPVYTGDFGIVDCWVCNDKGDIHPGLSASPVPVNVSNLGGVVGKMGEESYE